ncbi:Pleckstrin-like protein [Thalictrum thalictroides]|uniref:Pleckstrin-like protein n=1 Tax=Thalictrum thalictroides TaxID=46969 RepID=A0A7J6WW52_THATH|nr:Pleckstrin-like protein [Thalictrum thalictroides]
MATFVLGVQSLTKEVAIALRLVCTFSKTRWNAANDSSEIIKPMWQAAVTHLTLDSADLGSTVIKTVSWIPPDARFMKANCDGSSRGNPGQACSGIVFRDHKSFGEALMKGLGHATNYEAVTEAIMITLEATAEHKLGRIWIESDSKAAIKALQSRNTPWTVAAVIAAANSMALESTKEIEVAIKISMRTALGMVTNRINEVGKGSRARDSSIKEIAEKLTDTAEAAASAAHTMDEKRRFACAEIERLTNESSRQGKATGVIYVEGTILLLHYMVD